MISGIGNSGIGYSGIGYSGIATILPSENPRIVKYLTREKSIPRESQVCGASSNGSNGSNGYPELVMAVMAISEF
jgi:hypothetical protein